jgi:Mg-chelatase subunit ChlD
MTERPSDEKILKYEIIRKKKKKPESYSRLARDLDYKSIKDLTYYAIQNKNMAAIHGLIKSNVYAAVDALECDDGARFFSEKAKENDSNMPELYFFIRRPISEKYRRIFRRLARQSILKTALKISSRGIKGTKRKTVPYYHVGMPEFDLDETIQHNPLKIHNNTLDYKDIYGIKRKRQKRKVVLILDTSGSMYGRLLLNAALTTSVLAYNMEDEYYSIILFSSTAMIMKGIKESKPTQQIIDDILDSEAAGFTNISIGLEKGLEQFKKLNKNVKSKFGILITDGNYNRGENPLDIAKKYPKLNVIAIPSENDADRGIEVCRELAKIGNGKVISVKNYKDIPRALIDLLANS